jgi:hypothetical protein
MITFVMVSAGKHRTYDGHVGCAVSVLPFQNWKLLYDSCIVRYLKSLQLRCEDNKSILKLSA